MITGIGVKKVAPTKTFYQGFYHSGSVACWLGYETTDLGKILEWVKLHVSAGRAVSVQIQERII